MKESHLAWLATGLLVAFGLWYGGGYGASIDEPRHAKFGEQTLEIYLGQRAITDTAVNTLEHGPFYSFVSYYAGGWVSALRPGWVPTDGRHFIYYLSFVMATIFIGLLSHRYVRAEVAWLVAGLFFTQPLLLGHAFINPKDIPFMAFFLGALTLGVLALPASRPSAMSEARAGPSRSHVSSRTDRWRPSLTLLLVWTLLVATGLGTLWLWKGLLPSLQSLLAASYRGEAPWPIQTLFHLIATDAYKTPLELYNDKLVSGFDLVRRGTTILSALMTLVIWGWAAWLKIRPTVLSNRDYVLVAGAGLMLGLDTAIRSVAPYAAIPLAILYLRYASSRRKAGVYILILATVSVVSCLATWPYLWQDTLQRYIQSVLILGNFPWGGIILFNGQIFSRAQQPWYFVPELMLLQFTLPLIALALLGLAVARRRLQVSQARVEVALLLVTLALPVAATFRPGAIVYNNFRQLLFTVPALFLVAALGMDQVFQWLQDTRLRIAVAAIALLPGIAGMVRLHPYEYIYYNALAGIGGNVYSRFESDYWCTSYRAATEWVNANAPMSATLYVGSGGIKSQVLAFSRPDLLVLAMGSYDPDHPPTLGVLCDGKGGILDDYPDRPALMTVEKDGAILSQVKDLRGKH
jgi:hypothetical protein